MLLIIVELAMFNFVVFLIAIASVSMVWKTLNKIQQKWKDGYKVTDFKKFIEFQNATVFNPLKIELKFEPLNANWIEFCLMDDEKMYEEEIALRKHRLNQDKDQRPKTKSESELPTKWGPIAAFLALGSLVGSPR